MGLKAGPYPDAKAARIALVEAGYTTVHVRGTRPGKWKHPIKPASFAVRILNDGRAKIVPYPDLSYLDYRTTSDAERAGQGFNVIARASGKGLGPRRGAVKARPTVTYRPAKRRG